MNVSMDAIDLGVLDNTQPFHLDPGVWSANLEALREFDPAIVNELEQTAIPASWRAVAGLDGCPTFRIEAAGEPAAWLTGTAAPRIRATALLRIEELIGKNAALPGIGVGAELRRLLDHLPAQRTVYVFERELVALAVVLRLQPLAAEISGSRCIIVPAGREQEFLSERLTRNAGLLPATALIGLPYVAPQQQAHVQHVCEEVSHEIAVARNARLTQIKAQMSPQRADRSGPLRLAITSLGSNPRDHRRATTLSQAAEKQGWNVRSAVFDSPLAAGPLPIVEQFANFSADAHVCIEHDAGMLPITVAPQICRWFTNRPSAESTPVQDDVAALAASPVIAQALKESGWPADRIIDFHWAIAGPNDAAPLTFDPESNRVLLVGDLPDASADACRITQASHRRLWQSLTQHVAKKWDQGDILRPRDLLRNAEKACGITLAGMLTRTQIECLIIHSLIPSQVLETISCGLLEAEMDIRAIGHGWERLASERLHAEATNVRTLAGRESVAVRAAVFAGPLDLLSETLLRVAASGVAILVHHPGRSALRTRLGDVLRAGEHVTAFADKAGLRDALADMKSHAERYRARNAGLREHLLAGHTWATRLRRLAVQLGLAAEENRA